MGVIKNNKEIYNHNKGTSICSDFSHCFNNLGNMQHLEG